ncbi:MAG TPA: hypothetical protein DCP61_02030 [Treponema sp.]|nr:hypothetical protein [Treponema sp.]
MEKSVIKPKLLPLDNNCRMGQKSHVSRRGVNCLNINSNHTRNFSLRKNPGFLFLNKIKPRSMELAAQPQAGIEVRSLRLSKGRVDAPKKTLCYASQRFPTQPLKSAKLAKNMEELI